MLFRGCPKMDTGKKSIRNLCLMISFESYLIGAITIWLTFVYVQELILKKGMLHTFYKLMFVSTLP